MIFDRWFSVDRQYDSMDCGPACLCIVARHYGCSVSLQQLRLLSHTSIEGTSLAGLQDAARALGLRTRCVQISFTCLAETSLPCIVHWEREHFVVVNKISPRGVSVTDPAHGQVTYGVADFLMHWAAENDEGYALLIEPGVPSLPEAQPPSPRFDVRFLLGYLRPYRRLLIGLPAVMLLGSLIQFVLPWLTAMVIDRGINPRNIPMLQAVLLGQFALVASRIFFGCIQNWMVFFIGEPLNITLVKDFLAKLTRLPLGFFDNKKLGDSLQRIQDYHRVETFLTQSVLHLLLSATSIVVFGIVLAAYSHKILIVFLLGTLLHILWVCLFLPRRKALDVARFHQLGKSHGRVIQFLMGIREIRLNGWEAYKIAGWKGVQDDLLRLGRTNLTLTQTQETGGTLLLEIQGLLITYIAACSVIDGAMSLGVMLAVQFVLGQLTGAVSQLTYHASLAQEAVISLERISEIRSLPEEEEQPDDASSMEIPPAADIVLSSVTFQYDGPRSPRVLDEICLTLRAGETTAIAGPSGCGKTTLAKLLLGISPPTGGGITIGGTPLAQLSLRRWREACGLVMQDGYLFTDTIAGNIGLSGGAPDMERVQEAAHLACIDAFIATLPLGYQTMIGPDGHGLSQGQKQRILIARALYRNPDYLLLDEATNALDAVTEAALLANLRTRMSGKTVIIVAHRLSSLCHADRVVVLDGGRVVENGAPGELAARQGFYHRLIRDQSAALV